MIGRKVKSTYHRVEGTVIDWQPLSAGMCDVVVRTAEGKEIAIASTDLSPVDPRFPPLPTRAEAQEQNRVLMVHQLRQIRRNLINDFHRPWPGLEFGKTLLGQAVDAALDELGK